MCKTLLHLCVCQTRARAAREGESTVVGKVQTTWERMLRASLSDWENSIHFLYNSDKRGFSTKKSFSGPLLNPFGYSFLNLLKPPPQSIFFHQIVTTAGSPHLHSTLAHWQRFAAQPKTWPHGRGQRRKGVGRTHHFAAWTSSGHTGASHTWARKGGRGERAWASVGHACPPCTAESGGKGKREEIE